jgi:ubiquinone/menaquinone biosynthesis C-methylase UbiE
MTENGQQVKQSIAEVFDRASDTYDRTGVEFFGIVGRTLVQRAGLQPGEHVLELGCGRGAATLPAAERVGPRGHVLALDLAEGMVSRLRADVEQAGLGHVRCRVGDAEEPDVDIAAWDVVLASLALFFLPDHRGAMRSYRELLRPRGRLAFSWFALEDTRWDPVFEELVAELPASSRSSHRPGEAGAFASPDAMDAFLREAGYDPVTEVVPMTVRYPDDAAWWATLWSHGRRATMERLRDENVLDSTMTRVREHFDGLRGEHGALEWSPGIGYTVARVREG